MLLVCIEVQYEAVKFLNRFLINEKVYVQDNLHFIQAVKFQYNNLVKYNTKYSVFSMCCNQSRLEQFFLDLLFISLLIRTLFNIVT